MVRNQEELNNVRIFLGSSTSINNFMVYWGWGTQILRLRYISKFWPRHQDDSPLFSNWCMINMDGLSLLS
jgi:hypothetical protein